MRPLDFTLILIVFCATWQTGASAQPPTPPSTATPGLISTAPAAQALLDAAIKTLTKPEGVDVKFVQTIFNRSQPATITGRSVTAPGKRSLVELDYQQMKRQAKLKVLCDGDTFYRLTALPESNQLMTYKMKDLQEALDKLASNEAERVAKEDVEKHQQGLHGFDGIAAQLKDLSKRMFFSAPVETTLELPGKPKQNVKMIEGQWTPVMVDMIAPTRRLTIPGSKTCAISGTNGSTSSRCPARRRSTSMQPPVTSFDWNCWASPNARGLISSWSASMSPA
jgi:hypothetical protein